jgi:hypothetical protein
MTDRTATVGLFGGGSPVVQTIDVHISEGTGTETGFDEFQLRNFGLSSLKGKA